MTLFIPDVSHHQEDIDIQGLIDSGAAALLARVGQGAGRRRDGGTYGTTRDRKWQRNLAEANRLGLLIRPYWYVGNLISPDENARLAAEWVGDTSLPWMLDHEDASGDIAFYQAVLAAFERRGLHVALGYVPHWYWNAVGGGSLAGPPLVNSAYPGGSGTAAQIYGDGSRHAGNFANYGGNSVALLQFTNKADMAGQLVDCSAFKGTQEQLAALLQEENMPLTKDEIDQIANAVLWRDDDPNPDVNEPIWAAVHYIRQDVLQLVADVAELKGRPVADVDEAALAAELEARGVTGVTAAEVKQIVLGAFARAGQPDGGTV